MTDGEINGAPARRWPFWLGLGLASVLVACGLPVGLAVAYVDRLPLVPDAAANDGAAGPARTPRPGDPVSVTQAWLQERIAGLLDEQAAALLRGDERAFLAIAIPGSPAVTELRRQFRSLRALRVTVWRPRVGTPPARVAGARGVEWRVPVDYDHCFVTPACATGPVTIDSRWVDGPDGPRIVTVEPSGRGGDGPRPWEASELVAAVGERTIVAAARAHRALLPRLSAEAERAAAIADRFAVGARPERYRIFYATGAEWRRWYGGDRPEWTAGYAVAVGGGHYEVVLNGDHVHPTRAGDLLRHELTHAASLPAGGSPGGAAWWLVEGMAELAGAGGRPVARYDGLTELRRLLAEGGWDGRLATTAPPDGAADWEVSARYGVGYLAVRHLVDRFGERRLLAFFGAVVHQRLSLERAARDVLGEEWSTLHDDCVRYVLAVSGVSA